MSLISGMVRACRLAGFSFFFFGEDAVKMSAHGMFLLINPESGVRNWGWGAKNKPLQCSS